MNILAIDDERMALTILRDAIREAEPMADIYSCSDAEEGILYAKGHPLDVAFLDINMGMDNGIETAKRLRLFHPSLNVIFVTGYSEYMPDAIRLHASGYVLKPVCSEDIRKELDNLWVMPEKKERESGIRAHTFGRFELYAGGNLVRFSLSKSKEMLAYLINNEGSSINRRELADVLFEDQPYTKQVQDYISKIFMKLKKSLNDVDAGDILIKGRNMYAVDPSKYKSDVRDLFDGDETAIASFKGEYMSQYSWSEDMLAEIERRILGE